MSIDLRGSIKNLGFILKNTPKDENILKSFLDEVANILRADILLIDLEGNIIYEINNNFKSFAFKNKLSGEKELEHQVIKQLENINDVKINVTLDNIYTTKFDRDILKNLYGIFLPICIHNENLSKIIIYRKDNIFEDNIDILCEYIISVLGVLVWNYKIIDINDKQSKRQNIKTCMSTLSYSELEAILNIFEEIKDNEGLVIASKIADKACITRSVIVNALRKFESARIIETRSLGMKGTYIKVLNEYLPKELDKFKS